MAVAFPHLVMFTCSMQTLCTLWFHVKYVLSSTFRSMHDLFSIVYCNVQHVRYISERYNLHACHCSEALHVVLECCLLTHGLNNTYAVSLYKEESLHIEYESFPYDIICLLVCDWVVALLWEHVHMGGRACNGYGTNDLGPCWLSFLFPLRLTVLLSTAATVEKLTMCCRHRISSLIYCHSSNDSESAALWCIDESNLYRKESCDQHCHISA